MTLAILRQSYPASCMLEVCRFKNRTYAAARLYAAAFAADPMLAADPRSRQRYWAARAAAEAGCGRGTDAVDLEESERAHWLKQAREWLRADVPAWVRLLNSNPAARGDAWKALSLWQVDPDLACVRDPGELEKLAEGERKEYLAIGAEVAAVLARIEK